MICPNCKTENPSNANFCFNCAFNLKEKSVKVTQDSQFAKYIPKQLLEKLQNSDNLGIGIENERRIVTILFCDVVGSTERAESLDPEEWTDIINDAFDFIIPPVYKYEGIIARLMGDGILAFFGAPISHEDDPERAVLAGLEMLSSIKEYSAKIKQKWSFNIDLRIGINTGLVVVGEIGSDLRVEYTAMGDAINVASRMESTAKPGSIQVTQSTFKHISYLFEAERLGQVTIKGKSEPVTTFEIKRKNPTSDKRSKLDNTSFVEREKELNHLINLSYDVIAGKSNICWISGEAGIGKSRLIAELFDLLELEDRVHLVNKLHIDKSDRFHWFQTSALPYQISTPYGPIIDFFSSLFGITLDMSLEDKQKSLMEALQQLPTGRSIIPYISLLLQIPVSINDVNKIANLDPAALQEETILSVIAFLQDVSDITPLVLVFDDIQWADQSSKILINHMLDFICKNRVLLIIMSRESPNASNPILEKINELQLNYSSLDLSFLTDFGASSLISNILKVENLSDEVRNLIFTKSSGNPFFVEELVKSFIDSGYITNNNGSWVMQSELDSLNVPDTLTNLLMTRLDQLDDKTRRVAQSASVIGREFMKPLLICLNAQSPFIEESLNELEQREWIKEKYGVTDTSYFFKHVLSRDVAYNSLLIKKRKELHKKIADCLRGMDLSKSNDIGRHLYESEEFEEALPFLIESAERAMQTNAFDEALDILWKAEKVQDKLKDFQKVISLYLSLGKAYGLQGNVKDSGRHYKTLLDLSKGQNDSRGQIRALNKLAENAFYARRDTEEADLLLLKAEELGNLIQFPEGLVETSAMRCLMHQSLGQFDKSAEYERLGIQLSGVSNQETIRISFSYNLIISYLLDLKLDKANDLIQEFLDRYEPKGEKYYTSSVYGQLLSYLLVFQGKFDEAISAAKRGLQTAKEIDARYPMYLSYRTLGEIYQLRGNPQMALEYFDKSMIHVNKNSHFGFLATSMLMIVIEKIKRGEDLPILVEEAKELLSKPNGNYWASKAYGDLGYYYLIKNELDKAEEYFTLALTKISAPYYIYKPYNMIGMIELQMTRGKFSEANEILQELENYCNTNSICHYHAQMYYFMAMVKLEFNEIPSAKEYITKSRQFCEKFGIEYLKPSLLELESRIK